MDGALAALFERKEGVPSFGTGGLLGMRGGFPKMPSFRVSSLRCHTTILSVAKKSHPLREAIQHDLCNMSRTPVVKKNRAAASTIKPRYR